MIDTCITKEEIDALKQSIQARISSALILVQESLSLLPQEAVIGLITFGRMIHLYDLSCTSMSRSYTFKVRVGLIS